MQVLFRQNRQLRDPQEIQLRLTEAEARLTMAEHYKNPYPRYRPLYCCVSYLVCSADLSTCPRPPSLRGRGRRWARRSSERTNNRGRSTSGLPTILCCPRQSDHMKQ